MAALACVLLNRSVKRHESQHSVILDGKRNDIGSTAAHYQQSQLGAATGLDGATLNGMRADWATVNGYLGSDGITPFLSTAGFSVFLCSSNQQPISGELQNQPSGEADVMTAMAQLVREWGAESLGKNGLSNVGAVVEQPT